MPSPLGSVKSSQTEITDRRWRPRRHGSCPYAEIIKITCSVELDDRYGGSSSANDYQGVAIGRGAHYDLAYPAYYGAEVLKMFEQLGIIEYQAWSDSWSFKDRQHLIPPTRRQQCFQDGSLRKAVMPKTAGVSKINGPIATPI